MFSTAFVRKMEQESFSCCVGLLVVYQKGLHNAGLCITALPHPVRKGPRSCFLFSLLTWVSDCERVGSGYNLRYRRNLYANFQPPDSSAVWNGFSLCRRRRGAAEFVFTTGGKLLHLRFDQPFGEGALRFSTVASGGWSGSVFFARRLGARRRCDLLHDAHLPGKTREPAFRCNRAGGRSDLSFRAQI